ncbi:uncharacterized protein E0L32_008861, partial [Thyridium curvatum]
MLAILYPPALLQVPLKRRGRVQPARVHLPGRAARDARAAPGAVRPPLELRRAAGAGSAPAPSSHEDGRAHHGGEAQRRHGRGRELEALQHERRQPVARPHGPVPRGGELERPHVGRVLAHRDERAVQR